MVLLLKIVLITALFWILLQDVKERQVYWFLFPIAGICCGILHYTSTLPELFAVSVLMNLLFVLLLLSVIFLYARLKLKARFKDVFGLGDLLLFVCLSVSFSTVSFIVIFISALIFSLLIHLSIRQKESKTSVPLAGYMSVFFICAFMAYWTGIINFVYSI